VTLSVGFITRPTYSPVGTGTITSKGGRGVCGSLDRAPPGKRSMKDSDTSGQESVAGPINYEAVGKELLRAELDRLGSDAFVKLQQLGRIAEDGDLGSAQVAELRQLHNELGQVVELVEDSDGGGDATE